MARNAGIVNLGAKFRHSIVCAFVAVLGTVMMCQHASEVFFNVAAQPRAPVPPEVRRPSPSAPSSSTGQKESASAKLLQEKERLMREIKAVELNLAMALQEENMVTEEPEEDDPELSRLRRKYNIKTVRETPPGPDSVSRREFNEAQPIREARGIVLQLALLRAAADDDDWSCDEECLASLAGENKLSPDKLRALDKNLQADVRKVQGKVVELEFAQRWKFCSDTNRRISKLNQFLKVVPSLRAKVS